MIAIVDYGVGNFGSVHNMLRYSGFESIVTSDADQIISADRIILPGVGAFDAAMDQLLNLGLVRVIKELAEKKVPILGICLGAQLLTASSEEGVKDGLNLLPARCVRFDPTRLDGMKIPHMDWDDIEPVKKHPVLNFEGLEDTARFYFAHSYHMVAANESVVLAKCRYGYSFNCILGHDNIVAAQFHPEKSHKFGFQFLKNFASWCYA
jgi:glutamine amidotransferase